MEYVVLLLLILGIWLLRELRPKSQWPESNDPQWPPEVERWDRRSSNRASPPHRRRQQSPAPFDASSSRPANTNEVLKGSAYVVDGDTITISKRQIRLFGIDAPEMNHPFGKKAKWALVALCKGQTVRAEVIASDDHGRSVAKCTLPDGRDLSAEMVRQGLAIDWPKYSNGAYSALEPDGVRKKLWLATARQKGHMHIWHKFEASKKAD